MIKLSFAIGSKFRKVFIDGRKVTLLSAETSFVPLELNLDKLDDPEMIKKIESTKIEKSEIEMLRQLNTEKELADDIRRDFRKSGWRLIKQE